MKTRRLVPLLLCVLFFAAGAEIHHRSPALAYARAQQGPPDAPPPTSPPSEPIILHGTPPRMPPDFQGPPRGTSPSRRFDAAATRKDAAELAALASQIPSEVDLVSKGVLPKDLDRQLKEIQKLAKRLRGEVAR